jgi:hypothetical protein
MMTYMTYNFFFALMTLLPVLIWFAVSLWVALDADKMPEEAWALAGESKNVWSALAILLMWPFGLIFYLFVVRRKIAAFARTINEDALIGKAADRLRKESHDKKAAHVPFSHPPVSENRDAEVEAHEREDDSVFNYEESDAREDFRESGQSIPPKPDYAPTVGNSASEESEDSETKTTAYPVAPPKPTRDPRVGNDRAEG